MFESPMRIRLEIPIGRSRGPSHVCLGVRGYEVVFIRGIGEAVVVTVCEGGNEATGGVVRDHSGGSTSSPSSRASWQGNWYQSPGLART